MLVLLKWHVLLLNILDEIKHTAVRAAWTPFIMKKARLIFSIPDEGPVIKDGVVFDESLVLLLVRPVRYNNLKSSDFGNVSVSSSGMGVGNVFY